jgi:hypothetical protein
MSLLGALGLGPLSGFSKLKLVDQLKQLRPLPEHRWDPVSIDGEWEGDVVDHDCGGTLAPAEPWAYWDFTLDEENDEEGNPTTVYRIRAEYDVLDKKERIFLGKKDDNPLPEMSEARISVRPIIQGTKIKISVRLKFRQNGEVRRFRFDGRTN